ncbi:MAG: hypothetical protein J2P17_08515, partial [Mycobacterium sp.]|nr:hypothetical protein [Mycobacterium sp.]
MTITINGKLTPIQQTNSAPENMRDPALCLSSESGKSGQYTAWIENNPLAAGDATGRAAGGAIGQFGSWTAM